ncbi:nitrate ABC transporter substrate-binding protein [Paenibacillus sp. 598K]|uniref:ABC transporter substrate-binding protein n=1 Tax=Paenibacillus sp. 598K TaxID=1117987 RepID=UPI000FFAADC3|nr:ABC transporter substrate-binding protein [Paenibacillus sp. 598K]GBF72160.1 nitrate ABC transporter substrate-binding protein [Paenibacillus sp. 598K]
MSRNQTFRYLSSLLFLLILITIIATGCADRKYGERSVDASSEPVHLVIADTATNPVFRVAKSKGLFEKYGIDAEILTFATPAEGINSLFIKQSDIAWGADFPILNAVSKGDYSIIAATGTNTDASAAQWKLYVQNDIQEAADLKNKKLSTLRGTFLPYLWDEYLKTNGVSVDDTEQIGQGGFDEAYIALKKGEIDATWAVGAALIDKLEALEGVHVLTDMSQTHVRIGGAVVATNTLIGDQPEALSNFLRALDEASQYASDHPEETAEILFKETKQPKEATLRDLATINWKIGFSQASFDSLSNQKAYMIAAGIIKDDFDLTEKLNLDSLKQAVPERVDYGK